MDEKLVVVLFVTTFTCMAVTIEANFFGDYDSVGSSNSHYQTMAFDGSHSPHQSNLFENFGPVDSQYQPTAFDGNRRSHQRRSNNMIDLDFNAFDGEDEPLKNGGFVISSGGFGRGGGGGGRRGRNGGGGKKRGGKNDKSNKNKDDESAVNTTPSNVIDFAMEKSRIDGKKIAAERRKKLDNIMPELDDLMLDITHKIGKLGDMYKELRSISALRLVKERQSRKGWKERKEQDKREKLAMNENTGKKDKQEVGREDEKTE